MFDLHKWREWLREKADELNSQGFAAEWASNDEYLRGTALSVRTNLLIGDFRNYESGLVDYEVMDTETKEWRANESMIQVDDENFAEVFQEFLVIFRKRSLRR